MILSVVTAVAEDPWAPGPLHSSLPNGTVHVWRADLAATSSDLDELLCSDEHARAQRMLNEHDRELWRRSRGLLRALLGRYLQMQPQALRFSVDEHGKPALSPDRLYFNLSHSAQWALYAFSCTCAVGVDVEVARRPVDEIAIATRMLGAAVAQRLQALDADTRRREFLRAWVRHEAALKCLGVGIGGASVNAAERQPWVADVELGVPNVAAAVATAQPARGIRCWEWQA